MSIKQRLADFELAYDVLFSEVLSDGDKLFIDSKNERVCRFCGKSEPQTSFKSVAHAIPESLGNKRVILLNECDECNSFFSNTLEDSFDKYTKPYRLLCGIKGKNKVPSYKTRDKSARIDVDKSKNQIEIKGVEEKIIKESSDTELIIKFEREPYIPINVYKALLKMALSVIDFSLLPTLEEHINWIRLPGYIPPFSPPFYLVERVSFGPSFNGGSFAVVFVRRSGIPRINPYMMFFLSVGNLHFQIPIPEKCEVISSVPLFPIPAESSQNEFGYNQVVSDLSSNEIKENNELIVGLGQAKI
jgi:hypothetical protein